MRRWGISRYCDEYHCTPLVAEREIETDPDNLGLAIMEMRAFASVKAAFDQATDKIALIRSIGENAHLDLVMELTLDARIAAVAAEEAKRATETHGPQRD